MSTIEEPWDDEYGSISNKRKNKRAEKRAWQHQVEEELDEMEDLDE